jgi:hypothetical protein
MNRSLPIAAAALLAGCGWSDPSRPVPVSGTVTLEGKPLAGAQVTFAPAPENEHGSSGSDVTGSSGYFKVMANGRAGLAPGGYRVVISKTDLSGVPQAEGGDPYMAALATRARAQAGEGAEGEPPIEATFVREVSSSGNTFDFDLKLPPPPEPPPEEKPAGKGAKRRMPPGVFTGGSMPPPPRKGVPRR